jgi:tetratricopeptide (TPR) repeat protein
MTNQRKNILTFVFLLILVGLVLTYVYSDLRKSDVTGNQSGSDKTATGQILLGDDTTGSYKVSVVSTDEPKVTAKSFKMPALDLPLKNYSNLDDAVFKLATQKIDEITKNLKKDPRDELSWLGLGIYRKMLGDYTGAVDILNYLNLVWPNDYVPYNNLADLYQYYIKNYPLAEKNWLKVIELKPDYIQAYESLNGLYASLLPNRVSEALPILLKGLKNNPKSVELMVHIARYYREMKDITNAGVYYDKAAQQAKTEGNQPVVDSIVQEKAELSR